MIFSNKSFAVFPPRGPGRSQYSCLPTIWFVKTGSHQQVSRVLCSSNTKPFPADPCCPQGRLSEGKEVTDDQLQAMLKDCHDLQSLKLGCFMNAVSARGLASLTHIRSMHLRVNSCASLQSVFMLTHIEKLELMYCINWEETLPHLSCTDFPHLVSLKVETEWDEPRQTFQHLTQLQSLKHLSLATAAPREFTFAVLSRLTSLHMDQFSNANLEGLQQLLRLRDLDLLGHPTDEELHMLARLTTLTALQIESTSPEYIKCHLSSVIKLSSLKALKILHCEVVDDSAHYSVTLHEEPTYFANEDIFMISSLPNSPFVFKVYMW